MKRLCLLFFVAVLVVAGRSCFAQEAGGNENPFSPHNLVGQWINYATEITVKKTSKKSDTSTLTRILCNACPEIDFHSDSTGIIKSGGDYNQKLLSKFVWRSKNSILHITNVVNYPDYESDYLTAGQYTVTVKSDNKTASHKQIILTDATGARYILTRKTAR